MACKGVKCKELSTTDRRAAFCMLKGGCFNGTLAYGSFSRVAREFECSPKQIRLLWESVRRNMLTHLVTLGISQDDWKDGKYSVARFPDTVFETRRQKNCGRPKVYLKGEVEEKLRTVPLNQRRTYRQVAKILGCTHTHVMRLLKQEKVFRRHVNRVKPVLTEQNKHWRMSHIIDKINMSNINNRSDLTFLDMMNEVHLDEKWFYLCRDGARYILLYDENDPVRRVKHKSHITKVMFLCAQARPRYVHATSTFWDGKIGIWPVGEWRAAQRGSTVRPAGTMEWHNQKMDANKYFEMLTENVMPALMEKWPDAQFRDPSFQIILQQDGATSHWDEMADESTNNGDCYRSWVDYLDSLGLGNGKIMLLTQPANSPDLNLNDLGFFVALQAMYYLTAPRNSKDIIEFVQDAYDQYPREKINRIWITLQSCMAEILKIGGDNAYKIPHMGKEKLEKQQLLPRALPVPLEPVLEWLDEWGAADSGAATAIV